MKKIIFFLLLGHSFYSQAQIWVNNETGQGDYSSSINASCKNSMGEAILCGFSVNQGSNKDILLLKVNSSGDTLWSTIYDGPGNGMDEALDVVNDANNNIYLTGYQRGNGTGTDMVIMKYSSSGQLIWVQSYLSNINTDQTDRGNSIIVDGVGNVYVTGQTDIDASSVNNDNYITLKYNSSGSLLWSVQKNGLGNGADRPVRIVLDAQNNPIVTGRSFNGFDDDYLTIKYNGQNGAVIWEKTLDRTHHDRPTDMIINTQTGNIYVTGRSRNINYDYVTVAYNSSGTQIWQAIYDYLDDDRATSMCFDSNMDVIVTGQSDFDLTTNFNYNMTTVKYNGLSGVQMWFVNYIGSTGTDDIPFDIVCDNANNTYILGASDTDASTSFSWDFIVQKISSAGSPLSTYNFSFSNVSNDVPSSLLLINQNELIICGYSEFIPIKHGVFSGINTNNLSLDWQNKFVAKGDNSNNSHAIIVDGQGNSYVAGYSVQYGQDRNFLLKKINPWGQTLWSSTLSGTSTTGSVDEAMSIGMDSQGFIYTCGFVKNTGTSYDVKLVKYNSLGDTIWTRTYDYSTVNASDKAYSMTIDPSGFIYLTGKSDSDPTTASNEDAITQKWDLNGNLVWNNRFNGTNNFNDITKVCSSSASGVYVIGKSFNGTDYDGLIIKYSHSGTQLWVKVIPGPGNSELNMLNIDNNENLVVCGFNQLTSTSDTSLMTWKYDINGNLLWSQQFDGVSHGTDVGKYLITDANSNVYVCGNTDSDSDAGTFNNDIVLLKYDSNGQLIWQKIYSATSQSDDMVDELRLNSSNEIVLIGESDSLSNNGLNYDFITLVYSASGTFNRSFRYEGIAQSKDIPSTMYLKNSEIFVTGGSINTEQQRNLLTIKYSTDPNAGLDENLRFPWQIYPNPASEFLIIESSENNSMEDVKLEIYNLKGQRFPIEFNNINQKIVVNISKLPTNVYMLNISNNQETRQEKVIIF